MLLYGSEPSAERVLEKRLTDLPTGPDAVAVARAALEATLADWGWEHRIDSATLGVSEVTTVVLAMECDQAQLALLRYQRHLTVELRCGGARHRFSEVIGGSAERARGIAMIDDLVSLWGVRPADDGEAIWFELR